VLLGVLQGTTVLAIMRICTQLGTYYSAFGGTKTIGGGSFKTLPNPDLKWEETQSLDLGFDLSAFKNRIQFNFDYYRNISKNLLF
jgi:outer membrane receptor protein involved in Fe transport